MRSLFRKITVVAPILILPFLFLTLSLCCFKMPGAHAIADCCSSTGQSNVIQKGFHFKAPAAQSSHCHCEQLTESYEKVHVASPDLQKFVFSNKVISFNNFSLHTVITPPNFFNYQSPPKVVQNSLPLFLQISVLRL